MKKQTLSQISKDAGFRVFKGQKVSVGVGDGASIACEVIGVCPKQGFFGYVRLRNVRTGKPFLSVLPHFERVTFH